jgi:cell fate regulator YaaT (PSP1 superfamily)
MTTNRPRVAGVRFRNAGRIFYFDTAGLRLEPGEYVVVETVRGPELAKVVIAPDQVVVNELHLDDLKPVLRLATEADLRRADELSRRAARKRGASRPMPGFADTSTPPSSPSTASA